MCPTVRVNFQVGDTIEVCRHEEGFMGSFYEASIIIRLNNGLYMVRYKTLMKKDESTPLMEIRHPREIRPVPPHVHTPEFTLFQYVNVFYNNGWWIGRIIATVPAQRGRGRQYLVHLTTTNQELYYPPSRIRLHREWANPGWLSFN